MVAHAIAMGTAPSASCEVRCP
ncbi:MAG: hypothetical protein RIT25_2788, partial [Planctomycetota bacterium]